VALKSVFKNSTCYPLKLKPLCARLNQKAHRLLSMSAEQQQTLQEQGTGDKVGSLHARSDVRLIVCWSRHKLVNSRQVVLHDRARYIAEHWTQAKPPDST